MAKILILIILNDIEILLNINIHLFDNNVFIKPLKDSDVEL